MDDLPDGWEHGVCPDCGTAVIRALHSDEVGLVVEPRMMHVGQPMRTKAGWRVRIVEGFVPHTCDAAAQEVTHASHH